MRATIVLIVVNSRSHSDSSHFRREGVCCFSFFDRLLDTGCKNALVSLSLTHSGGPDNIQQSIELAQKPRGTLCTRNLPPIDAIGAQMSHHNGGSICGRQFLKAVSAGGTAFCRRHSDRKSSIREGQPRRPRRGWGDGHIEYLEGNSMRIQLW